MPVKKCEFTGCKEPAKYNYRNLRAARCLEHILVGMVWSLTRCECSNKQAIFGLPDDKWATCCKRCATPEMTNIKDPKCVVCKLVKPYFGLPGESKYTHCKKCATDQMIDVRNPKCKKCKKVQPKFGLPGDSKPTHCKACSSSVMVDLMHPKCKCGKFIPIFGFPGDARPTRCGSCKDHGMKDLVNPMCEECTDVRASFGMPGDARPTRCTSCKTPAMVDISNKKCASADCDSYAKHRAEDDGKRYCLHCILTQHTPADIAARMKRCVRKEIYVLAELERRLPWLQTVAERIQWDVGVDGGCTGNRPDMLLHFGSYVLIIEVDERQHGSYCLSGEKKRMQELWQELGCPPLGHIRFNPDAYTDASGVKHKGVFTQYSASNKEPRLKAAEDGEFGERIDRLQAVVEDMIERRVEGNEFLFYTPEKEYDVDSPDPELADEIAAL